MYDYNYISALCVMQLAISLDCKEEYIIDALIAFCIDEEDAGEIKRTIEAMKMAHDNLN